MSKNFLTMVLLMVLSGALYAQCGAGETEVYVVGYSYDVWGEESYWEVVPNGAGCGNGTLAFGGSVEVGCPGNGPTGENGIPDFGSQTVGPFCLTTGQLYDLVWVDWYGDGGLAFDLYQNGALTNMYIGGGGGNTWTFEAGANALAAYDSPCGAPQILPDLTSVSLVTSSCIASFGEIRPQNGSCSTFGMWCENGVSASAWAYFIAEEGKSYEISTCNAGTNFDTQVAVYYGGDCASPANFQLVSSNDNAWGGCNGANDFASVCYASCLIPGGTYYIQVDGAYGQTGTAVISVDSFLGDEELSAQINDTNCPLNSGQTPSGSLWPSIVGTGSDFDCVWTGPGGYYSEAHFIYNLGPGEYHLVATTNCGSVHEGNYFVGLPDPWAVSAVVTPSSCPNATDGTIEVTAGGGTPGYAYNITGPNGYQSSQSSADNLSLGDYNVTVTDGNGCSFLEQVYVGTLDDLTFDLSGDTILCLGDEALVYGPPGLNYLWNDGSQNQFFQIITDQWGAGTHALILTGSTDTGCTHTDALVFIVEVCQGMENATAASLQVYPNPSDGTCFVQLPAPGSFEIFDAAGRQVFGQQVLSARERVLVNLAPGSYVLKSSGGEVAKVVIR